MPLVWYAAPRHAHLLHQHILRLADEAAEISLPRGELVDAARHKSGQDQQNGAAHAVLVDTLPAKLRRKPAVHAPSIAVIQLGLVTGRQ